MKEGKNIVTGSDFVNVLKESDCSLDSLLYLLSLVKTDGELGNIKSEGIELNSSQVEEIKQIMTQHKILYLDELVASMIEKSKKFSENYDISEKHCEKYLEIATIVKENTNEEGYMEFKYYTRIADIISQICPKKYYIGVMLFSIYTTNMIPLGYREFLEYKKVFNK